MLNEIRVAVCGDLPTTCKMLRREGVSQIDAYSNAIDLSVRLRRGAKYHLILVHAPNGAGLGSTACSYKTRLEGDWETVPIRMLNEPAYLAELSELRVTLQSMARVQGAATSG